MNHIRWPEISADNVRPVPLCGCAPVFDYALLDPVPFFTAMEPGGKNGCADCVAAFVRLEHGEALADIRSHLATFK